VRINGADLGVYHFEAQPDESLLRLNRRMPGSIYSGNLPGSAETEELWRDVKPWKKVAWRNDAEKKRMDELQRLLDHVSSSSVAEFTRFARREIDLERIAAFDALDVVFGGDQHDFRENHKLYFDPYRGRWEPVAWNFRGFKHDNRFNLVENPLLLRLKLVPEYLSLRNRIVHDLLTGRASPSSVQERGVKILMGMAQELASDPYWDAYKLLPRVTRFHRRMVRPMNPERLALVFDSEMTTFQQRQSFLMRELKRNPLWILVGERGPESTPVHLVVDGRSGVRITAFRAEWPSGCEQPSWQVLKEGLPITAASKSNLAELGRPVDLHPGVGIVARPDATPKRGAVFTESLPVSYPFLVQSNCQPERIEAVGIQLATRSRIRSRPVLQEILQRMSDRTLGPEDVPRFVPGESSTHPWRLQTPPPELVRLGPGVVEVGESRVFGPHQTVRVEPGSRLRMGAGASLVFHGPVHFHGEHARPVVVEKAGKVPWGGIVLQGPDTAGSTFQHVVATGGTVPVFGLIPYPGMLNIHDTRQVALKGCRFGRVRPVAVVMDASETILPQAGGHMATGSAWGPVAWMRAPTARMQALALRSLWADDVVHAAYVQGLMVEDLTVEDAAMDALDLEFTRGELRRVEVIRAGDDGVDFMGVDMVLVDSAIIGCRGNAVSSGEESQVHVRDTLAASSRVGVLAKNAASVELTDSVLFGNETGVRVYQRTIRYAGPSQVQANVLYLVGSQRDILREDRARSRLDLGRIQRRLPLEGALDHLAQDVLGLQNFEGLPGWLEQRLGGGTP
jgi:hypothetical protein